MRTHVFLASTAIVVTVLSHCAVAQSSAPAPFSGPSWETTSVKDAREAAIARLRQPHPLIEVPAVLDLADTRTRRFVGCQVRDGRVPIVLRSVHDRLALNADQDREWSGFADRVTALLTKLRDACWGPSSEDRIPLAERLALMAHSARIDVEVLDPLAAEVRTMTALLSPAQRVLADDLGRFPDRLFHPMLTAGGSSAAADMLPKFDGPSAGERVESVPPPTGLLPWTRSR